MRATIEAGLARRPQRVRIVAVAAAVVVFAVGAVLVTQVHRSPHSAPAPAAHSLGVFDRCWAAVRHEGKTGAVPDVSTWASVAVHSQGDDTVISFTADGKPMFCETTTTTVTVSDPNATPSYAAGTHNELLFTTKSGVVGGVVDPAWPGIEVSRSSDGVALDAVLPVGASRLFTLFSMVDPTTTPLGARRYVPGLQPFAVIGPRDDFPLAPPPLLSIVDRPADLSSPSGKAFAHCLAQAGQPLPDQNAYVPGALLTSGPYQVVLGRAPGHAVACVTQPDPGDPAKSRAQLYRDTFIGVPISTRRLSVPGVGPQAAMVPFIGVVPPGIVSMEVFFHVGDAVPVTVANGTFAMWLPPDAKPTDRRTGEIAVVTYGAGNAGFDGYLPMK